VKAFAAKIGKWQLTAIEMKRPAKYDRFEVVIRPIKALAAFGEEMGEPIGPQLVVLKPLAGSEP
jgi:hypothetical protein